MKAKSIPLRKDKWYPIEEIINLLSQLTKEGIKISIEGEIVRFIEYEDDAPEEEEEANAEAEEEPTSAEAEEERTEGGNATEIPGAVLKLAFRDVFKHTDKDTLEKKEIARIMSFDLKWCSPKQARAVIDRAIADEVLKKTDDGRITTNYSAESIRSVLSFPFEKYMRGELVASANTPEKEEKGEKEEKRNKKDKKKKRRIPWEDVKFNNDTCNRCKHIKDKVVCKECYRWDKYED